MVWTIAAWRRFVAVSALALLAVSCAQLPVNVVRPVTSALATPEGTPLAALVQQRRQAAGGRNAAGDASGFLLMPRPGLAYASRLALIEGATRTLDLQYYAVHADISTTRLTDGLRAAAARGVRVRLLIDDFHSTGRDAQVLALALVPGIDVRLFNPLPGGRASALARALGSIDDASRIQQRMHNKLFIADNVLGVTGGRNLGDAYFGNGKKGNFVDLDVLAAGPIVQDMSRSFDRYWNNERAYPAQSLVPRAELESLRDDAAREAEAAKKGEADTPAPDTAANLQPLDLKQAAFVWAPAVLLADKPAKIAADAPGASSAPGLVVTRPTALGAASEAAAEGDTVVEGLLHLVGQARRELLIISPYFVPGPDMKRAFAALTARGVRVRVLTNSLASNDAPIAHVGYARHREELLAMGVQLYEMRGDGASLRSALGRSGGGISGDSRAMLHSKVLVMDRRLLVVGSMNLDLRSQLQNTEVALMIRNGELSGAASDVIETTLREAAWHVERVDGHLIWRAPEGSGVKDTTTEPDASATLKLVLKLLGPLAPDSML